LGKLADPGVFLAIIGLIIIIVLHSLRVPGAILIGILATTILSIPMGITALPKGWKPFSVPAAPLLFKFDFSDILSFKFFTVFFTFLFVDIFDTVGTLVGVTTQAGLVDRNGNIPRLKQAFLSDAIGTVAGAALGLARPRSQATLKAQPVSPREAEPALPPCLRGYSSSWRFCFRLFSSLFRAPLRPRL